jgi:hypothetical protein
MNVWENDLAPFKKCILDGDVVQVTEHLQVWSPKFKPQLHQKERKKKKVSLKLFFSPLSKIPFCFSSTRVWTEGFTLARQALYHLSDSNSPLMCWLFLSRVSWTIWVGWLWTEIFLVSAPQVVRTIGMSHWCPAWLSLVVLNFELRSLCLLGRPSIHLSLAPALLSKILNCAY